MCDIAGIVRLDEVTVDKTVLTATVHRDLFG